MKLNIFRREPLPLYIENSENCTKKIKLSESPPEINTTEESSKLHHAMPMTCVQLRPQKCIDRSLEVRPNSDEFVKEITFIEGVTEMLNTLRKDRLRLSPVDRISQYPKVIFLGTGSCIPNKTRNVSSILVHTT